MDIRAATLDDTARIFAWRNDPQTVAMSATGQGVDQADHDAWFARALADPDRQFLIAELNRDPVAMIRFDRQAGAEAEVSINLAPARRGQGLAGPVLAAAIATYDSIYPMQALRARIRPTNSASHRVFVGCGFHETARDGDLVHYLRPA